MDWLAFIGSILSGVIAGLFTFLGVKMTINHDNKVKRHEEKTKAESKKPRLEIIEYKKIEKFEIDRSDCDVVLLKIKGFVKNDERDTLEFIYNDRALAKTNLIGYKYVFKNIGMTEINNICLVCNLHRYVAITKLENVESIISDKYLNYDVSIDKNFIKQNEQFSVIFYYVENEILNNAFVNFYMQDINGRYWRQLLFCPQNRIDISQSTTYKEFYDNCDVNYAIKCFEGKEYW